MSLKLRLLASIAASLLLTMLLGGAVLFWQAWQEERIDIQAIFRVTDRQMRTTLLSDTQHTVTMREIVAMFNGHRNIKAYLLGEHDNVIVASHLGQTQTGPAWFTSLIAPPVITDRIAVPFEGFRCTLVLETDATNKSAEMWQLVRDSFAAMLLFSLTTLGFVWLILGHSLRFFRGFQEGLRTISDGKYETRLAKDGTTPEFSALAEGFNHMAARLSSYRERNQRLQQQILSLQEEERAEIARDLHDEVGPYLFAIQVDADALAKSGSEPMRERAGAIREAALHVQRHVKYILRQLKPVIGLDFGLETAIDDLLAFWKQRHPDIRFERAVGPGIELDRRSEEVIYRIVQESLSNAVRHGHPKNVRINLSERQEGIALSVQDDGQGFVPGAKTDARMGGMGLKGMAERVEALNGRFRVVNREHGVKIEVILPRVDAGCLVARPDEKTAAAFSGRAPRETEEA